MKRLIVIIGIYFFAVVLVLSSAFILSKSPEDFLEKTPVQELDFGKFEYSKYMVSGFSFIENDEYRWSVGNKSKLLIPLHKNTRYRVFVTAQAITKEEDIQKTKIYINKKFLGELVIHSNEFQTYYFELPANLVEELNEIDFKYSYAVTPNNGDARRLAVMFKQIKFEVFD